MVLGPHFPASWTEMCHGVSNCVPPLYVVVEVLLFLVPRIQRTIYFLKTFGFYVATFGKVVSVVLDIINFNDAPLL